MVVEASHAGLDTFVSGWGRVGVLILRERNKNRDNFIIIIIIVIIVVIIINNVLYRKDYNMTSCIVASIRP